jgi:ATP-dependent helicase HepA
MLRQKLLLQAACSTSRRPDVTTDLYLAHMTSEELETGCLVRWTRGDAIGVVESISNSRVEVKWDDGSTPPLFARRGAPLERVTLPPRVRRRSNDEPGIIVGPATDADRPSWKVVLLSQGGRERVVPEADLRPDNSLDPADRLLNQMTPGSAKQVNITTATRYLLNEHFNNDLVSLDAARVDIKPHQVGVVHRVVTNYPHRYLLCDEVGLGKTIEAGLILKELRARGLASRVLIIVPPNLRRQWQFELKTKFNETFAILDSDTTRYVRKQGYDGNPFARYDSVIVSERWIAEGSRAKQVTECAWDLVIVDEAHHARSHRSGARTSTTQLYKLVRQLTDRAVFPERSVLFLTATPMQLSSHELYSLVEMLDPSLFPTEEVFDSHRESLPGLSRAVEGLRQLTPGESAPRRLIESAAEWLGTAPGDITRRIEEEGIEQICDDLSAKHLLSEILIRNRKAVVGGFMPRRAHRWEVNLTEVEKTALDRVEEYVSLGYATATAQSDNAIGFLMVSYQKMMASSIAALRTSLAKRRNRLIAGDVAARASDKALRDLADEDSDLGAQAAEAMKALRAEEADELGELVELLDRVPVDSKSETLREQMAVLKDEATVPKVLVFTEFRATQEHLADVLRASGWGVSLFNGEMSAQQKDVSVERFRDDMEPHVLISTEAGGEGRNFQFCNLLVNYDLPWNPMRVEQRIGRVDRIGQEHIVEIFNFWVRDSIEERILEVLERRINVFEETVGGLDPILGEAERDIRHIMQRNRSDRDEAIEDFGRRLEEQVAAARKAEVKLRDLIMDTKSFSREIAERIAGEESPITAETQDLYMRRLLAAVRTHLRRDGKEYRLHFHEPFLSDNNVLFPDGPKRRVVFRADERSDSELVEFMAFGHPIIDAVTEEVTSPESEGAAGGRRLEAGDGLAVGTGWLLLWQITVPDLRERTLLVPLFVSDDGDVGEEWGLTLVRRTLAFGDEESIPSSELDTDSLEEAKSAAEAFVSRRVAELEADARASMQARIERERERMTTYYTYRLQAARDRLASTEATVVRLRSAEDETERRILPVWVANLEAAKAQITTLEDERHRRLEELDRKAGLAADYELVQAVRVDIRAPQSVE